MNVSTSPWFISKKKKKKKSDSDYSWVRELCRNPEHDPPGHMVFPEGKYTHICPGCGSKSTVFTHRPWL